MEGWEKRKECPDPDIVILLNCDGENENENGGLKGGIGWILRERQSFFEGIQVKRAKMLIYHISIASQPLTH